MHHDRARKFRFSGVNDIFKLKQATFILQSLNFIIMEGSVFYSVYFIPTAIILIMILIEILFKDQYLGTAFDHCFI